jgi:hypothetical protein
MANDALHMHRPETGISPQPYRSNPVLRAHFPNFDVNWTSYASGMQPAAITPYAGRNRTRNRRGGGTPSLVTIIHESVQDSWIRVRRSSNHGAGRGRTASPSLSVSGCDVQNSGRQYLPAATEGRAIVATVSPLAAATPPLAAVSKAAASRAKSSGGNAARRQLRSTVRLGSCAPAHVPGKATLSRELITSSRRYSHIVTSTYSSSSAHILLGHLTVFVRQRTPSWTDREHQGLAPLTTPRALVPWRVVS